MSTTSRQYEIKTVAMETSIQVVPYVIGTHCSPSLGPGHRPLRASALEQRELTLLSCLALQLCSGSMNQLSVSFLRHLLRLRVFTAPSVVSTRHRR